MGCEDYLENVEVLVVDAHHVNPGDLHVNTAADRKPIHLGAVMGVLKNQFRRNDIGAEDLAGAVDVLKEEVESSARFLGRVTDAPVRSRHDAWNDVEGDQALFRLRIAVDRKRDPDFSEKELGFVAAVLQGPVVGAASANSRAHGTLPAYCRHSRPSRRKSICDVTV